MQLTDQVTSLELSRRLKELNVKQQSLFYWADTRKSWKENNQVAGSFVPFHDMFVGDPELEIHLGYEQAKNAMAPYNEGEPLSAFTASELGEMLPSGFVVWSFSDKSGFGVECSEYYRAGRSYGEKYTEHAETLPDAMARMLVYLIEQGLVKV